MIDTCIPVEPKGATMLPKMCRTHGTWYSGYGICPGNLIAELERNGADASKPLCMSWWCRLKRLIR